MELYACAHTRCTVPVNFHEPRSNGLSNVQLRGFRRVILDEVVIEPRTRITTRGSDARVGGAPLDSLRGSYQAVTMSMASLVSRGCNLLQPSLAEGHGSFYTCFINRSSEPDMAAAFTNN